MALFENLIYGNIMKDTYEKPTNPKFQGQISIGSDFMTTRSLRSVEKLQNLKNRKWSVVAAIFDEIL